MPEIPSRTTTVHAHGIASVVARDVFGTTYIVVAHGVEVHRARVPWASSERAHAQASRRVAALGRNLAAANEVALPGNTSKLQDFFPGTTFFRQSG